MDIKEKLKEIISSNDVCLFMKGVPEAPQCGFSMTVSNILKHLNVNFKGVNVLEDENLRQGIKEFSDWPTIPQLYVKKEFVGGTQMLVDRVKSINIKSPFPGTDQRLIDAAIYYDKISSSLKAYALWIVLGISSLLCLFSLRFGNKKSVYFLCKNLAK